MALIDKYAGKAPRMWLVARYTGKKPIESERAMVTEKPN